MIRIVVTLLVLGLLAGLGLLAVVLLHGDATPPPGNGQPDGIDRSPATSPATIDPSGISPRQPGAGVARTAGSSPTRGPPGAASPDPNPNPAVPRILRVARMGMRTESNAPPARPAVLPRPPLRPAQRKRPDRCEILCRGIRPLHVEAWVGSPWGTRRFPPEAGGRDLHRFRLVDPWAGNGPRILHILLDRNPYRYVDRFLPRGSRRAKIRIGPRGDITGRLVGANGRGILGWVRADGQRADTDGTGRFRLRDIHAGRAVVHAFARDELHAVRRAVLACPGGPHEIRMEPGAVLRLQIEGLPEGELLEPPIWACAVTGVWPKARNDFAAETSYHRTTANGRLRFGPVPTKWRGVVAIFHPRYATQFASVGVVAADQRPVQLVPRTVLLGTVVDARTGRKPRAKVAVTTSADDCSILDLALDRKILQTLRTAWTHPIPFLGQPLVAIDRLPASGHDFEIHADPALRTLAVRVEVEGYHPMVKTGIRSGGVRNLVFRLRPDRPSANATVVLELPAAPAGAWDRLEIQGAVAGRTQVDARRGEVRFGGLAPGVYWFKLEGDTRRTPLQVDLAEGASLRVRFPD